MLRTLLLVLSLANISAAQDAALERVKNESNRLRGLPRPTQSEIAERTTSFHSVIRDWVETQLPRTKAALGLDLPYLNGKMLGELDRAKLYETSDSGEYEPGIVSRLAMYVALEDPTKLVVSTGVQVPCGVDDAVFVYDYSHGEPKRVLESAGSSLAHVQISKPDAEGNQSILTLWTGVQCASSWNMLVYKVYRLSGNSSRASSVLEGSETIYLGTEDRYQVRLNSQELLLELTGGSIDPSVLIRKHVLHFQIGATRAERFDPVAFRPQDFVDEWLTRPWSEMESMSVQSEDILKKWHDLLADPAGDFQLVQHCREHPEQWIVGIGFNRLQEKDWPEPLRAYFLVARISPVHFEMLNISFNRLDGCEVEDPPASGTPWLFPKP